MRSVSGRHRPSTTAWVGATALEPNAIFARDTGGVRAGVGASPIGAVVLVTVIRMVRARVGVVRTVTGVATGRSAVRPAVETVTGVVPTTAPSALTVSSVGVECQRSDMTERVRSPSATGSGSVTSTHWPVWGPYADVQAVSLVVVNACGGAGVGVAGEVARGSVGDTGRRGREQIVEGGVARIGIDPDRALEPVVARVGGDEPTIEVEFLVLTAVTRSVLTESGHHDGQRMVRGGGPDPPVQVEGQPHGLVHPHRGEADLREAHRVGEDRFERWCRRLQDRDAE